MKSILITDLERIGDTLLTTPAVACLRRHFRNASITAIAKPLARAVLAGNPDIDEIVLLDEAGIHRTKEAKDEFTRSMRNRDFDIVICFSAAVKDYITTSRYGGKLRVGSCYLNMWVSRVVSSFCLHKRLLCPDDPALGEAGKVPLRHEADQNIALVDLLGADTSVKPSRLVLPISSEDRKYGAWQFEELAGGFQTACALQLSSRWFWGNMQVEGITGLIRRLAEEFPDVGILCIYDPLERELAESVKANLRDSNVFISKPLSLKQFAAFLERCSLLVTHHSGATHIAAAVGIPSVVVFNPEYFRYYSFREAPYNVDFRAVNKKYTARQIAGLAKRDLVRARDEHIEDIAREVHIMIGKSGT